MCDGQVEFSEQNKTKNKNKNKRCHVVFNFPMNEVSHKRREKKQKVSRPFSHFLFFYFFSKIKMKKKVKGQDPFGRKDQTKKAEPAEG